MEEKELEQMAKAHEENMERLGAHIDLLIKAQGSLQKPTGIFRKKCPRDGTRLTKNEYTQYIYDINHYKCHVCDYEYATKESNMEY